MIYGKWRNRVYMLTQKLSNIKKFVEAKSRYFIKRIGISDTCLQMEEMENEFLLLLNSNPVIVIEIVMKPVIAFGNMMTWMAEFLVKNFERISTLSWDILICITLLFGSLFW